MKKLSKVLLSVFLLWACVLNLHAQVASRESNLLESKDIIAFRPIDIMATPQTLMKVWIDEPMPLSFYTPQEKEAQKLINEKTADGIITYSPLSAEKEWTSIDFEEITPYTWKWIDLELLKPDGSLTKVALRRPHEWLRGIGADSVGKQVYLDMPEMGVQGWATVKAIRVNQLDTRFWDENRKGDYVSRPITGKFEHESSDVYYLHFGDNPEPLGVTGSHPIWSIDRNTWVGASELQIGEKVKTQDGSTILKSRTKSDKRQKVYNLEIYKDHNFLVSTDKILVHNGCLDEVKEGKFFEKGKDVAKQFGTDEDGWHPSGGGGLKDKILGTLFEGEEGTKLKKLYGKNPDIGLGKDGNILIKPRDGVKKGKMFDTNLKKSDFIKSDD